MRRKMLAMVVALVVVAASSCDGRTARAGDGRWMLERKRRRGNPCCGVYWVVIGDDAGVE